MRWWRRIGAFARKPCSSFQAAPDLVAGAGGRGLAASRGAVRQREAEGDRRSALEVARPIQRGGRRRLGAGPRVLPGEGAPDLRRAGGTTAKAASGCHRSHAILGLRSPEKDGTWSPEAVRANYRAALRVVDPARNRSRAFWPASRRGRRPTRPRRRRTPARRPMPGGVRFEPGSPRAPGHHRLDQRGQAQVAIPATIFASITARSLAQSMGLARCSLQPMRRHSSRSSGIA